jgi:hypothetical protein
MKQEATKGFLSLLTLSYYLLISLTVKYRIIHHQTDRQSIDHFE